jgi:hypothetical protein
VSPSRLSSRCRRSLQALWDPGYRHGFELAAAPGFKGGKEIAEIAAVGETCAMAKPGIVPGGLPGPGRVIAPEMLATSPVADLNWRTMPGLRP